MELKQLEFFIAACNCGSLSKAAVQLYTTQPNVSKVIRALETELGKELFERTRKGLRLTAYGKTVYEYATNIMTNANLITNAKPEEPHPVFHVSTYSSNTIAWLLVNLYQRYPHIIIKHYQGTVDDITTQVAQGISELGILYVSKKQLNAFRHIISHKKLDFTELGKKEACIYMGPNHPLYSREYLSFEELSDLRFVWELSDYFSIEHHFEQIDVGAVNADSLHPAIYTNSEHLSTDLLLHTDLVDLGIDLNNPHSQYKIKNMPIEGEDAYLTLGYVVEKEHILSKPAEELIQQLKAII